MIRTARPSLAEVPLADLSFILGEILERQLKHRLAHFAKPDDFMVRKVIIKNERRIVKLNYHADTDSLYIELCDRPSVDSREISEGVVLDYDAEGRLVGIDVDNAGNKVELQKILLSKLPGKVETEAA